MFQSPDGDFVYSDEAQDAPNDTEVGTFQSPDGDFVYSDVLPALDRWGAGFSFQSPDGDFVYSDSLERKIMGPKGPKVSIP